MTEPQPQPAKPNQRRSRRKAPKGSTKARCYKGALGLGANVALTVLDLSETGIRLLIKANLAPGQEVEINLDNVSHHPVKLIAEVVWSVATADGNFCVGARFQKAIPYADLQSLARP